MTTNQMRYFVTVCENMSFSKAANALYITQPAISKHIAALERELDTPLIDRSVRGTFKLTRAGEAYLEAFRSNLAALDNAALRSKYIAASGKPRYRIGLPDGWLVHRLLRTCREAAAARQDVELDFYALPYRQLNAGRADGSLDFVLTLEGLFSQVYGYNVLRLTQIHPALLLSAAHPLAGKPDLRLQDLKDVPYLVLRDTDTFADCNRDLLFILDGEAPRWMEMPNPATLRMNVLAGLGYTVFEEWSPDAHNPLFHATRLEGIQLGVVASWKKGFREDIAEQLYTAASLWAMAPKNDD